MKLWFVVFCCLLVNCGGEYEPDEPEPPYECINCDLYPPEEEEEDFPIVYEPVPHMYFSPNELMFYYDAEYSDYPYPPHTINVCNATNKSVFILDAFVDKKDANFGGDDSAYFVLSALDLPHELIVGDCLPMEVSFVFSTYQRWAQLIVHTSFTPNPTMSASLSGKVFFF